MCRKRQAPIRTVIKLYKNQYKVWLTLIRCPVASVWSPVYCSPLGYPPFYSDLLCYCPSTGTFSWDSFDLVQTQPQVYLLTLTMSLVDEPLLLTFLPQVLHKIYVYPLFN